MRDFLKKRNFTKEKEGYKYRHRETIGVPATNYNDVIYKYPLILLMCILIYLSPYLLPGNNKLDLLVLNYVLVHPLPKIPRLRANPSFVRFQTPSGPVRTGLPYPQRK